MTDDTRALALELCDAIDAYLDPDNQYTESRLRAVTRLKKLTRDAALAAARRESVGEADAAWVCDWVPDDLNPGPECPYCVGQMCARFDGLGCHHGQQERHGYPIEAAIRGREGLDGLLTAIEKMAEYEMAHPLSGGLAERFARVLIEAGGLRENTEARLTPADGEDRDHD